MSDLFLMFLQMQTTILHMRQRLRACFLKKSLSNEKAREQSGGPAEARICDWALNYVTIQPYKEKKNGADIEKKFFSMH